MRNQTTDVWKIFDKIFKNGHGEFCGWQTLRNFIDHTTSNFLKGVFGKFCLTHAWIVCQSK